ncbi:PKD domain-containing protein [Candidatus Bipolaricaulota bacterium]|nr:PKD domain-containing protein [Candidatus Bipolaricaulota bacterium]
MRTSKWMAVLGSLALIGMLAGCAMFNSPPVANFTWAPFEPLARTDITFSDSSTDSGGMFGGGGIVSWNWDFGDSDSSTSPNPRHAYDKSGTYTVRLTVIDDGGETATISKQVTITASLAGTWRGEIINPGGFSDAIELVFTHSVSGGIQGTAFFLNTPMSLSSISFDPAAKRVQFQMIDIGIRLDGTLDASETRIVGYWYVLGIPAQGFSWDVTRQ